MQTTMQAIEITQPGKPEVLQICERPLPQPGPGEVLVRVLAAGVNRPDVLQRMGKYQPPPGASDLPGLELAGEIVGGDVAGTAFKRGDLICALVAGGAYAQYCLVPTELCMPMPSGLSPLQAASLPETVMTVWSNVFWRARLAQGESLLVQGGSSGIGVMAIQIAAALGHAVYATAGSAAKCEACCALGARAAINYREQDFAGRVLELTAGKGVDVILDMVGGSYLARHLECLADDGRLVLIALQGGARAELDLGQILRRRLQVTGSTLRPRELEFKAALAKDVVAGVWPLLVSGRVKPVIHHVFPLAEAKQAHMMMEEGAHIGKIMLECA